MIQYFMQYPNGFVETNKNLATIFKKRSFHSTSNRISSVGVDATITLFISIPQEITNTPFNLNPGKTIISYRKIMNYPQ